MTGSPMAEVLRGNLDKIQASDVLERMGLERISIFFFLHTERRISTQKRTLQVCLLQ